ncbi:energy transducer TonB [Flavobacterium sp. FlaQc-48]|uniref:energy transducer TonB n=1 Tax=Flavobacterium sp. FlaQc-48 TaxID=3374181 RepID=UPI003757E89C
MKKLLILILICSVQSIFSQTRTKDSSGKTSPKNSEELPYKPTSEVIEEKNQVYNTAGLEVRPEFPGGQEAFDRFLKENYKNPKNTEIKGKVYLTFIIEKDGSLSDIKVLRDIGFETGAEAIRVLKMSPKWIPGKQNNTTVRTLYSIPVSVNNFVK